jgi:hypothetical protein
LRIERGQLGQQALRQIGGDAVAEFGGGGLPPSQHLQQLDVARQPPGRPGRVVGDAVRIDRAVEAGDD